MKATAAMIGFCLRQGIDVEEVRSDKRDTKHVRQRRKVARYLRNEGFLILISPMQCKSTIQA